MKDVDSIMLSYLLEYYLYLYAHDKRDILISILLGERYKGHMRKGKSPSLVRNKPT